nr:ribonuclease domain-containing protein [Paenibacillus senegalensis]
MKVSKWIIGLLSFILLFTGCLPAAEQPAATPSSTGSYEQQTDEFAKLAAYIKKHGSLPDHYLTKEEAREKGWIPEKGNLHEVAPGYSIGGDRFYNREGRLPDEPGRIWYEADVNYESGHRGPERIVFSNDGLIYKTVDHYDTFERLE